MEADPRVDVVLTDLHLPGETGLRLAERCALRLPGVSVVLMSAALPPDGTVLPPSVCRCVHKPVEPGAPCFRGAMDAIANV